MKIKKNYFALTCLLSLASICFSETQPIREFDIKTIEELGAEIYQRDKYAAKATDILFEEIGGPEKLKEEQVNGWIVGKKFNKYYVRFIKQTEEGPSPVYDVKFSDSGEGTVKKAKGKLTTEELAKYHARTLAIDSIPELASSRYNTVVLPDVDGDGFLVYALAASTNPDLVYIGGHYRMTVSEDGKKIERIDRLYNSCLVLKKSDVPKGSNVVGMMATHVVSNTPVETHVFACLSHKQTLIIGTLDKKNWLIENGKIKLMEN